MHAIGKAAAALALGAGIFAAAPSPAHEGGQREIVIGEGDLLEKLIKLDQAGIDEMRAEIAEARADIVEAIADIRDAREELRSVPGGRLIVRVAFAAASEAASTAVAEALKEARAEIDDAERRLASADVTPEERVETQGAINGLREDLAGLESALADLVRALAD
jgi:uncharacterized coiled-coil DUF342 family protein